MNAVPETPEEQQTKNYLLATCSALGGFEEHEVAPGKIERVYTLGDEALACLKDLKRFIRFDSQNPKKFSLACLAEFNVLETDILPIITLKGKEDSEVAERFVLACVELLVPMTWPAPTSSDAEFEEHDPNLLDRYRNYKLALLAPGVFEAVMKLLVAPLSTPRMDRSIRDQTVIRLVLYFFRNLACIPDLNASYGASTRLLDLSSLQENFLLRLSEANVIDLLLVIASNSAEPDAAEWNVLILDIIHHLLFNANPKDIFLCDIENHQSNTSQLSARLADLLKEEHEQKRLKLRHAPTRHSRFGGSYSIKAWGGDKQVIHKQEGGYADLGELIDAKKKRDYRGVKRKQRDEIGTRIAYHGYQARKCVKNMTQTFLSTCFNAFYLSLIKDIEREEKKIVEKDHLRMYYTMQWFLEYLGYEQRAFERAKKKRQEEQSRINSEQLFLPSRSEDADTNAPEESPEEQRPPFDYDLVASAIDLRAFLLCLRRLRTVMDDKLWLDAQVCSSCVRQMLLTVDDMSKSTNEEYQNVAEYIISNIYHEQTTLNIFIDLLRRYNSQSYGYLEEAVLLTDIVLKMLERYSKKNQTVFVRKTIKQKPKTTRNTEEGEENNHSEEEDERDRELAYREHVFKFESFEDKYLTYDVIRIYCVLLEQYQQIKPNVLHCITSLFHRVMVKRKVCNVFWKLPVLYLFKRILQEAKYLPRSPAMDEMVKFIRYCTRLFFQQTVQHPLLFIELLFANTKPSRKALRDAGL